ncbi:MULTISPECIES: hypothetical protein [Halomonas]|uniref:DUF2523 domain-containing protein n=1 Tax=Halomonas halophila TaxID=29573 RepID=A0ABQ0U8B0_9GAMM|nr:MULTISPECIES: hypothetical protein [Halomonas]MDR5891154.1 hypothetical protein [Halomonas salina]WJY08214.1 hypothetical protein QWG60_04700 [Halomonas halophila]GEK74650.1 hypothetical protein HHA04nite_31940 [Halomonas halophila]
MPAILVSILSGFATYLVSSLIARVAGLVVFTTIGTALINGLLSQASSYLGQSGQVLWFVQLAGFNVGLSSIGAALMLRATMNAWSLKPSAAITGGK